MSAAPPGAGEAGEAGEVRGVVAGGVRAWRVPWRRLGTMVLGGAALVALGLGAEAVVSLRALGGGPAAFDAHPAGARAEQAATPAPVPEPTPSRDTAEVDPLVASRLSGLSCGTATATSFHDRHIASGLNMSYETVASPYWPLGTIVKITHHRRSVVGIVQDFGPAAWAVAQHHVPAIVDLSTDMMRDLTGHDNDAISVRFQVLEWGSGARYRGFGPAYDLAYACD